MNIEKIEKLVYQLLLEIGEDPERSGIKRTPQRVAEMYSEILSGTKKEAEEILEVTHELEHDQMIIIKDIPFYSMCEHHLLPFFGTCHIAYIPSNNRIVGISKLVRVIDIFSKKLQVQERLTTDIMNTVMNKLKPKGVAVVIKARHLCMEMRGIQKPNSLIITSDVTGIFRSDAKTREEFLDLIK